MGGGGRVFSFRSTMTFKLENKGQEMKQIQIQNFSIFFLLFMVLHCDPQIGHWTKYLAF